MLIFSAMLIVINVYCLYFWYDVEKNGELKHRLELMEQQRELTVDMEMQEPARLADYDGPWKDGYDYSCRRTQPVKMRRTYYRKGKKLRS